MGSIQNMMNQDYIAGRIGEWSMYLNPAGIAFRLAVALILAAAIGWERTNKRHSLGLRSFIIVTLSGTTAGILDYYLLLTHGTTIFILSAASVISATMLSLRSILFNARTQIRGLTTAAALCMMGLLGVTVGVGLYTVAVALFIVLMFVLSGLPVLEEYLDDKSNHFEVHLELNSSKSLPLFASTIRKLGMRIDDIEYNPAYAGSGISVYSVSFTISSEELKKYKSHQEIIDALATLEYIEFIEEL